MPAAAEFPVAARRRSDMLSARFNKTPSLNNTIYVTASQSPRGVHLGRQAQCPQALRKRGQRKTGDKITGLRKTKPDA